MFHFTTMMGSYQVLIIVILISVIFISGCSIKQIGITEEEAIHIVSELEVVKEYIKVFPNTELIAQNYSSWMMSVSINAIYDPQRDKLLRKEYEKQYPGWWYVGVKQNVTTKQNSITLGKFSFFGSVIRVIINQNGSIEEINSPNIEDIKDHLSCVESACVVKCESKTECEISNRLYEDKIKGEKTFYSYASEFVECKENKCAINEIFTGISEIKANLEEFQEKEEIMVWIDFHELLEKNNLYTKWLISDGTEEITLTTLTRDGNLSFDILSDVLLTVKVRNESLVYPSFLEPDFKLEEVASKIEGFVPEEYNIQYSHYFSFENQVKIALTSNATCETTRQGVKYYEYSCEEPKEIIVQPSIEIIILHGEDYDPQYTVDSINANQVQYNSDKAILLGKKNAFSFILKIPRESFCTCSNQECCNYIHEQLIEIAKDYFKSMELILKPTHFE